MDLGLQYNKMIKRKREIMNKLDKLGKNVKRNYVAHKGEMSF